MVFVVKATFKDETRRLTFDASTFPHYSDIQTKLRTAFDLPSTTQTYWVNVLYYPNEKQDARIMFKQHVCDATEYENAQAPFLHNPFPAPALVITVLLSSDPRLNNIHAFHRARKLKASTSDLATHMDKLEVDCQHKQTLLTALEDKSKACKDNGDEMGATFWGDRVEEKRKELNALEGELFACQAEYGSLVEELFEDSEAVPGLSLRTFSDTQEREEASRTEETMDELAAWRAGNDMTNGNERNSFPPLDHILQSQGMPPHRRHGRCGAGPPRPHHPFGPPPPFHLRPWGAHHHGHHGHGHPGRGPSPPNVGPPQALRNLFDRVSDAVNAPTAAAISPVQEIKSMLDGFLANLTNQLAGTFDGSPRVAQPATASSSPLPAPHIAVCPPAPPHHMPGAFEPSSDHAVEAQISPSEKPTKSNAPNSKLGKGGFRHKHVSCDGCLQGVRGIRYKCEQCPDYDLCGSCLPLLSTSDLHPSNHTFQAKLHRDLEKRVRFGSECQASVERHPATCNLCSLGIVGVRWKCIECPDWDCCSSCAESIQHTHPGHSFVKIARPTDYVDPFGNASRRGFPHPHVVCDGCDEDIRGTRYKCMHPDCPDYDLCQDCEAHPSTRHPRYHPMLKTKVPLQVSFESTLNGVTGTSYPSNVKVPERTSPIVRDPKATGLPHLCKYQKNQLALEAKYPEGTILCGRGMAGRCDEHATTVECVQAKRDFIKARSDAAIAKQKAELRDHLSQEDTEQDKSNLPAPMKPDNQKVKIEAPPDIIKCYARPETTAEWAAQKRTDTEAEAVTEGKDVKPVIDDIPTATATPSGARTPMKEPATPSDIFTFVRHLTIPPGSTLPAGAVFTKTWKLKHFAHGDEYDFDIMRLVHQSEGLLGPACAAKIKFVQNDVKDGEEFEISIKGLQVPNMPGEEIVEYWRLEDTKGVQYGQPLRLRLTVEEPQSMHSSLSHSAVIMPTPNRESSPAMQDQHQENDATSQAGTVAQSSVPTTPSLSLAGDEDDMFSLHSSDGSDDGIVEVRAHATPSTRSASVADEDEFDFVDESENEGL